MPFGTGGEVMSDCPVRAERHGLGVTRVSEGGQSSDDRAPMVVILEGRWMSEQEGAAEEHLLRVLRCEHC